MDEIIIRFYAIQYFSVILLLKRTDVDVYTAQNYGYTAYRLISQNIKTNVNPYLCIYLLVYSILYYIILYPVLNSLIEVVYINIQPCTIIIMTNADGYQYIPMMNRTNTNVRIRMCVCVNTRTHTHTHRNLHSYMYNTVPVSLKNSINSHMSCSLLHVLCLLSIIYISA